MKQAKTIMLQGTASDVGKSVLTAALCKILTDDGYRVAPFKSQNMSLNSYVTWDGKEIGRAQGMQADACRILATTDMNPILLKPKQDMVSQVIVHGKPLGDFAAKVYREQILAEAGPIVKEALGRLRAGHDVVVLEGAGSPAEINLKDRDIVNMRAAAWADAPVILVADIDRGGMFASIVGTLELLEPEERERVCGFIVNKFRGDVSLLQPGLNWLEQKTGKPVLGVIPFLPDLGLEDEDSLSLDTKLRMRGDRGSILTGREQVDLAIIRLPHISNFTDIDPFAHEADVHVRFITSAEEWGEPDAVILPGSKNTVDDLLFLRRSGLAERLQQYRKRGGRIVGLCGGYEMMGRRLLDPQHSESDRDEAEALGWFPFDVAFAAEKRTVRVAGTVALPQIAGHYAIEGYEIHTGTVHWLAGSSDGIVQPITLFSGQAAEGVPEGCAAADGKVWGTFVHGIMDNDHFRRAWINALRQAKGWQPAAGEVRVHERRELAFVRLAEHVRQHADIARIKRMIGLEAECNGDASI
ncbi:cobyric acid synthase [Paenibacillus sp. GCM10027626]|uniref:cobyric acid synthase n=1 Tax=Paenibacillus sp. GCM10027626 TaxID=3273411 RepID=UPI00363143C7